MLGVCVDLGANPGSSSVHSADEPPKLLFMITIASTHKGLMVHIILLCLSFLKAGLDRKAGRRLAEGG